jgi:octaprenyl-diphosphate synthase
LVPAPPPSPCRIAVQTLSSFVPAAIPTTPSLDAIRALLAEDLAAVDAIIRARLDSDVVMIRAVAEHIIGSGGKRLRPLLLLLAAGALEYRGLHHRELAAVVEFIHSATLLHDDVVDESALRRGRQTANAMFGNSAAVLVGDFLYSRAFQMMVGVDDMRVMQVLADATNVIAEGEVLQLMSCHNPDLHEQDYLRVIRCKTAKLFEAATRLGAILGGAARAHEDAMASYGMHLGTAFQLIDDVLDYSGDHAQTGKNLGADLAEGKPTLPLIHAMQRGTPAQIRLIRGAVEQGSLQDFQPVLAAIHDTGALDHARRQATVESQRAMEVVASLPHSSYRDSLLQLAAFVVSRSY